MILSWFLLLIGLNILVWAGILKERKHKIWSTVLLIVGCSFVGISNGLQRADARLDERNQIKQSVPEPAKEIK